MPDGLFHYGLLCGLAIALVVAAVTDIRRRQIDNWLTLTIAAGTTLQSDNTARILANNLTINGNLVMASGSTFLVDLGAGSTSDRLVVNGLANVGGVVSLGNGVTQRVNGNGQQYTILTATGGVTITRGDERASGDNAIYDFGRRIITMAGNVSLRRGTDTLNGGRLVIDLNSGISTVDGAASGGSATAPGSPSGKGRVTGTFAVPQKNQ